MLKQWPTLGIERSNWYQVHCKVDKGISHFIQSARDNIGEVYHIHRFDFAAERLEFIDCLLVDNKYLFPIAECVEGGVCGPNLTQMESQADNQ